MKPRAWEVPSFSRTCALRAVADCSSPGYYGRSGYGPIFEAVLLLEQEGLVTLDARGSFFLLTRRGAEVLAELERKSQ